MKKIIRLTESDLHRIVKETVNRILENELQQNETYNYPLGTVGVEYKNGEPFYLVNNPYEYVKQNGLGVKTMYKVGQIKARPSQEGQMNKGTVLDGGFEERGEYMENANSMIVRNPRGEEYQVPIDEFNRKYTLVKGSAPDENGYMTYNTFDKRQISTPVKHNVCVDMSKFWGPGQKQYGRAGDAHFVNPQDEGSYLIGDKELNDTHTTIPNNI